MEEKFIRTESLIGKEALKKIRDTSVIVFGAGGVGSYVIEALGRLGIGRIDICDGDCVSISNINRQVPALHSTLGKSKAEVMEDRLKDINPEIEVGRFEFFYTENNNVAIDLKNYDYIIDAIDSIESKLCLIKEAQDAGIPIISSMGAGNKVDPAGFEVADIYSTQVDPIAKIMRKRLKAMGIESLKVVYSKEEPVKTRSTAIGSISFVPGACGLVIAGAVFRDIVSDT